MGLTGQTHSKYDVTSVAISPDGQYILSGSDDGTVGLWDFQGNPIGQLFREHADMITSVAFSTNGQYIISGSRDGTVWLRLGGNWETWLQVVCDRLRYHPVFKNPESEVAKEACEVCRKYVWKE